MDVTPVSVFPGQQVPFERNVCCKNVASANLDQIDRSMKRLDTVVKEREDALRLLQTGQERARPGAWRKNIFGRVYWYGQISSIRY